MMPLLDRLKGINITGALRSAVGRRILFGIGGLAVSLLVLGFVWAWIQTGRQEQEETIAEQWNSTIRRLGIDPVYPPQEDISVGDIFLVVTDDGEAEQQDLRSKGALNSRALKLWHMDLREALEKVYAGTYTFPDTIERTENGMWTQKPADASVFARTAERKYLPLVLFPELTVATVRSASAGTRWAPSWFGASLGADGAGEQKTEIRISAAEAYGVPYAVAAGALERFCRDPVMGGFCTEKGARVALSSLIGSAAFDRIPTPDGKAQKYRVGAEIMLVSHVYMTRSIQTLSYRAKTFGARLRAELQLEAALQQLEEAIPAADAVSATGDSATGESTAKLKQELDEHRRRLGAIVSELAKSESGLVSHAELADSQGVEVTEVLQRPVVIGIRAARRVLDNSPSEQ